VSAVQQFRRGEELQPDAENSTISSQTKGATSSDLSIPVTVTSKAKSSVSSKASEPKRQPPLKQKNSFKNSTTKRTPQTTTNTLATQRTSIPAASTKTNTYNTKTNATASADPNNNSQISKFPPRKRPSKLQGTASIICGCYGTIHKSCTNCLRCGRITCEKEGYEIYCPFCGYWIDLPSNMTNEIEGLTTTSTSSASWLAKERLLRLDQTQASQMEVYDDQEDYYSTATSSAWLTQEERDNVQRRVEDRQESLRPTNRKQVLELQF
jgi:Putative zinc finger motif, C2HC5-type